ncbi:manganese catalase family protein [Alkalibacillus haloalkaliphilus]|uniref:Manganese catalase n=1 Tax=Alkalibacillus haloalkaliphilus TaxID=94136 RepID=A0A511W8D5_9BACI|nr:manganese catalase family protein [Alkalibacillus haloalkaliphilus]GEN46293.1 manganese catalase [Alkalibacillus haloalkaliphilus]
MIERFNRIAIELPKTDDPDPNAAAAVQELLGGRFGEMSTLNNYMFQSFGFRQQKKLKPFYDLICSISGEEFGHVELVSHAINSMLEGATYAEDPDQTPMRDGVDKRISYHFIDTDQMAKPFDSMGAPWTGDYTFKSGNLVEDLLHNYFLEIGARTHKMRVYEMTSSPIAREMIGYLLVRGGVHIKAYAKALYALTGTDMTKMLPVPNLSNRQFDYARKWEDAGEGNKLYTFSRRDYGEIRQIWKGDDPETGMPLEVIQGAPEGVPVPDYPPAPETFAPGISREDFEEISKRLQRQAGL